MEVMKSYSQGDRFLKMIRRTDPMIPSYEEQGILEVRDSNHDQYLISSSHGTGRSKLQVM